MSNIMRINATKRIAIRLSPKLLKQIKHIAFLQNTNLSSIIRIALNNYVKEKNDTE